VSAGRTPACPAIKSHDVIAVMMSDDPPTTPSCSRNRRRVTAGGEAVELFFGMLMLDALMDYMDVMSMPSHAR
jgi:hypothetical protein